MPPKRKRVKHDPDVIKTERDYCRATGRDDDDEFEDADGPELDLERPYTSIGFSRYKRAKLRKSSDNAEESFPFLSLPAEIRNMIYRYLVVSKNSGKSGKIRLDQVHSFVPGGIEIAIILTSRQVHNEAVKILYDENKCSAVWSIWATGIALRVDDPKTKASTSRSLRSGRTVDMIKHKGLIYREQLQRLRHVEFHIDTFDRTQMCDHMTLYYARKIYHSLWTGLFTILNHRVYRSNKTLSHGQDWEIVIHSPGMLGPRIMGKILEPITSYFIGRAVKENQLQMVLEGMFPENWKKIFRYIKGDGLITDKLVSVDASNADVDMPRHSLEYYFDGDLYEDDMYDEDMDIW